VEEGAVQRVGNFLNYEMEEEKEKGVVVVVGGVGVEWIKVRGKGWG
jgi:hypothetical protein